MRNLSSWTVALSVSLGTLSTAATADVYQRPVAVAAPFSWTGLYVGINGGYAWSNSRTVRENEFFEDPAAPPFLFTSGNFGSLAPSGGFGGAQAGANLQLGSVVLGIEVDGQWAEISDSSSATATVSPGLVYTIGTSNKVNRFGTLRSRVGFAWDKTLLYGTGGLAWGRVAHTLTFADNVGFTGLDRQEGTQVGYVVGAGLEHMVSQRLSLKLEYQYIDLGSVQNSVREYRAGAISFYHLYVDTHTDFHTVRLGLNYKLGSE